MSSRLEPPLLKILHIVKYVEPRGVRAVTRVVFCVVSERSVVILADSPTHLKLTLSAQTDRRQNVGLHYETFICFSSRHTKCPVNDYFRTHIVIAWFIVISLACREVYFCRSCCFQVAAFASLYGSFSWKKQKNPPLPLPILVGFVISPVG